MSEQKESKNIISEENLETVAGGLYELDPNKTYGLLCCICSDCRKGKLYLENSLDFVCPNCGSHRCFTFQC